MPRAEIARPPGRATGAAAPAVERASALLRLVADAPGSTLSTLARQLGAPKSSVSYVCGALVDAHLLERDATGTYHLGSAVLDLASAYLRQTDVVAAFHAECRALPEDFGETVQLARRDGADVVYLARREGGHRVQLVSHIGTRLPASCTATGKALLAELPDAEVREVVPEPLVRLTTRSARTHAALLRDLAATRRRGYAQESGEAADGMRCVAMPVHELGVPEARVAVSVSLLEARADERVVQDVVEVLGRFTAGLSRRMGGGA